MVSAASCPPLSWYLGLWTPLLSCCCGLQLWQDRGSVQGEYPFPGQNKSSVWHCCGQMYLLMRRWVICSEGDLLAVLWNNLNQYCSMKNYNFCHLTQCSGGKNCLSEEHKMWNGNSKSSIFLSACSLDSEGRPKPWEMTVWILTHYLYFEVPPGCVCVWMCTGTRGLYVPLPSNTTWRKYLHALFLPSSWDSGVFNWLLWG